MRPAFGLGRRHAQWLVTGLAVAAGASLLHALFRHAGNPAPQEPLAGSMEGLRFSGLPKTPPEDASHALICLADEAPHDDGTEAPIAVPAGQRDAGPAANDAPDRTVLSTGPARKASSRLAGRLQALTRAIETILADEDRGAAGQGLALVDLARQEAGGSLGSPQVAALGRMVSAYQASRFWRQSVHMQIFILALEESIKPARIQPVHLQQFLRIWTWRWGDCAHRPGTSAPADGRVPPHVYTWNLVEMLGPDVKAGGLLDPLIAAITRAPEGMPRHGARWDPTMREHAYWVAIALNQVLTAKPFHAHPPRDPQTGRLDFGQAYRILHTFLQTPAADARWKPTILRVLEAMEPTDLSNRPVMTKAQWEALLLLVTQSHVAETQPVLPFPTTMNEAITALIDPQAYRQGEVDTTRVKLKIH